MASKSVFDDFDTMTSEQMAARRAFTGLASDDDRRAFAAWIKSLGWLHKPTGKSVTEQMAEKQGTATCMVCGATDWQWNHKCPPGAAEAYRKNVMDATSETKLPKRRELGQDVADAFTDLRAMADDLRNNACTDTDETLSYAHYSDLCHAIDKLENACFYPAEQSEDALRVRVDAVLAKDYENGGHEFDCCRRAREYAVDDVKADLASITTVQAKGDDALRVAADRLLEVYGHGAEDATVDAAVEAIYYAMYGEHRG